MKSEIKLLNHSFPSNFLLRIKCVPARNTTEMERKKKNKFKKEEKMLSKYPTHYSLRFNAIKCSWSGGENALKLVWFRFCLLCQWVSTKSKISYVFNVFIFILKTATSNENNRTFQLLRIYYDIIIAYRTCLFRRIRRRKYINLKQKNEQYI